MAHLLHRVGIVVDVGGEMELPADPETIGERCDDVGTHDATVKVATLRPRVGEEDPHDGQRLGGNAVEERQYIAVHHPDLVEAPVLDRVEHRDHTGRVDFHSDHIEFRLRSSHLDRRLAVAEADVEHDATRAVVVTAEDLGPVEGWTVDVEAPSNDPLVEFRLAFR